MQRRFQLLFIFLLLAQACGDDEPGSLKTQGGGAAVAPTSGAATETMRSPSQIASTAERSADFAETETSDPLVSDYSGHQDETTSESRGCYPGFSGIMASVIAIPYAIAEIVITIAAVIYFLLSAVVALLCLVMSLVTLFVPDIAGSFFNAAMTVFSQSMTLFDTMFAIHDWYAGTC